MNKRLYLLAIVLLAVFSVASTSCGGDEPDPDNGSKIDPTKPVADPDGTITLSMRDHDSGDTRILEYLGIRDENFTGYYGMKITTIGAVTGLGNVSKIPTTGWADAVAIIPGNGYVACINGSFVRIYVIDFITNTAGGIIGAEVKYQYPFKGLDEALQLEKSTVTLSSDPSSDHISVTNSSFIPFDINTDVEWLHVKNASNFSALELINGVIISADINLQPVSREGMVTLTTRYGKTAKIKVSQAKGPEFPCEMVYVEGGTFTMGATSEQGSDAYDREKPTHSVTLSDFYIGKYEVTQKQWETVMGSNPSSYKGANLPVENVLWYTCQTFITKLNQMTGKNFRLPTEAEWEYAARGGKKSQGYKYAGSNAIDNVAWYSGNSGSKTHEVGTKQPNELGIYDMSGNVCEWCQDWYGGYSSSSQTNPTGPSSGSNRVVRGGGWVNNAWDCRVSFRSYCNPAITISYLGLRLALPK